jgi:hypothetical protein
MAATADQLSALGNDQHFQQRVKSLLVQQAGVVYAQGSGAIGYNYAKQILQGAINFVNVAQVLVNRTNLVASNVTYNFASGNIVTDATDAAIQSQIATDWSMLAGI